MELFKNSEGYEPMLPNLAGHGDKHFSQLEKKHQDMLLRAGISVEEWNRHDAAGRLSIVAQFDYLHDPRHDAVIYFQLYALRDEIAEMAARARADKASDIVVALRDVADRVNEILATDRSKDGAWIQAVQAAMRAGCEQNGSLIERTHVSDQLAILNQAALKFWGNAKPGDKATHPSNTKVESWLIEQGYTETLASKGATIIRPSWAATGRLPRES